GAVGIEIAAAGAGVAGTQALPGERAREAERRFIFMHVVGTEDGDDGVLDAGGPKRGDVGGRELVSLLEAKLAGGERMGEQRAFRAVQLPAPELHVRPPRRRRRARRSAPT